MSPTSHSTTEQGTAFEREVGEVLRIAGYSVQLENLLGHKKADLVAIEQRLGEPWRIAVECKDYDKRLGTREVAQIASEYQPLLDSNRVDQILLVTRAGLTPQANADVSARRHFSHQRLHELLSRTLDFATYLNELERQYLEAPDGLANYYQPPITADGDDLEQVILGWLRATSTPASNLSTLDSNRPIAVLGSYGIGKSSFAVHLAYTLALAAKQGQSARVPILLRLADISNEQSLEGLLGKHLGADYTVPGYSFQKFMALNSSGRFVVICDGFDEMRQKQSWIEFRYNIRQLSRLVGAQSRLVLLGRPTAFETDRQRRVILHQARDSESNLIPDAEVPDFQEIELRRFSTEQVSRFLKAYIHYRATEDSTELIGRLTKRLADKDFRDLASRPVQLRMLADLLPRLPKLLDGVQVAELYSLFVDHLIDDVIQREADKQARLAFSPQQRRHFTRLLAYWAWESGESRAYAPFENVPPELVAEVVPDANTPDEVQRNTRDLVIGSPLDRLQDGRLGFPHRSIQEFLVAEEVWNRIAAGSVDPLALSSLITEEIADFMSANAGRDQDNLAADWIRNTTGPLSRRAYKGLLSRPSVYDHAFARLRNVLDHRQRPSAERPGPWEILYQGVSAVFGPVGQAQLTPQDFVALSRLDDEGSPSWSLLCLLSLSLMSETIAPSTLSALLDRALNCGNVTQLAPESEKRFRYVFTDHSEDGQYFARVAYEAERSQLLSESRRDLLTPWDDRSIPNSSARRRRLGQRVQVGVRLSGGRLIDTGHRQVKVRGGESIRVRILHPDAIELARRVFSGSAKVGLDVRGLRNLILDAVVGEAVISEWLEDREYLYEVAKGLRTVVPLTDELRAVLAHALLIEQTRRRGEELVSGDAILT